MRFLLAFAPASLLFCLGSAFLIDLPGIYMDAVNPDYMAVHILHPLATNLPVWSMPGNMLIGRFPLLGNIYYGALPLYLGLPIYLVFGTGIEGIRLSHMMFGLLVLMGGAAFLRAWNVRPLIAAVALCALALDPAFLFAWRTQFHITLLPLAPLLGSVALTQSTHEAASRRTAVLAGLLAGIACYGYFIFGFLVPAAFVHAWIVFRRSGQVTVIWWLAGFAMGVAPYALAVVLLWDATGGAADFSAYIRSTLTTLSPGQSHLALLQRVNLFFDYVGLSVLGHGPNAMMIQQYPSVAPTLRLVLLLGLPLCGLISWVNRKVKPPGLPLLAGFVVGLFCLVMAFGDRLWLHHFAVLVPILYLACASVSEAVVRLGLGFTWSRIAAMPGTVLFGVLIGANVIDAKEVFSSLNQTGGVGYYSDAIDRFATDSLSVKDPTFYLFPDWGVFMSFVMLTHGTLPYGFDFDEKSVRSLLCNGRDVAVALVLGRKLERQRAWTDALDWAEPIVSTYRQRNGPDVLTIARWKTAARPAGACDR
jgi:hypothetical protein